ncbi:hypothetical protein MtrunA17_Chr1g0173581 [Medicago truncatula]|uniref:Uncharacterized protein n=1 Tax=Medicago truncatula TaxID=3880 RepID=A0A396JNZ7_MEDTR|nr:hypothetical protein MtrunA17_Chr1g0173581 [Medicago truncatula]
MVLEEDDDDDGCSSKGLLSATIAKGLVSSINSFSLILNKL